MNLTHRFSVPAKLDEAWAAFSRLDQIAPCFPGATVTNANGRDYAGFVKIKFGPIPLVYNGTAQVTELDRAAGRMVVRAVGQDRRGNGSATADVTATFTETGNITDVRVLTALSVTGRPAQFGGGVISDVSDRLLDLFVNCISARFRDGEFAADRRSGDGEPTVEIPVVGLEDPADTAAALSTPRTTRRSAPYVYQPPTDETKPHLEVIGTFLPVLLKRYWPIVLGIGIGTAIAVRVLRRSR
jgi:carbon monoxide dehydrogenase subunit G